MRDEIYRLRVLGAGDYARNKWRHASGRAPVPRANVPFDIGAPVSIVLHESTLKAVRSHWVDHGQEMRELDAFRRLAPGHSTFLDIGAAQGIFSAAFCALTGGDAYAFEPSPSMFEELTALSGLNPQFHTTCLKFALGSVAGTQQAESHGAQLRGVELGDGDSDRMVVETLDDFAGHRALSPDFVKIDVEGMELEVLRGGAETFSRLVEAIMLEVHPEMLMRGEAVSDVQALLERFGFKLFTLDFAPIASLASHMAGGRRLAPPSTNIVCAKGQPVAS
ncbi:MAG TPA: FkbM family methyltransferase [Solirubrobacteraceae bacterium]